ncbi:DUF1810 domain-containing protein [Aquamicrobium sp. LC103]|uniref:DUF1810 domain-containing protein n=1 Tax=Aquamicrobium sp. LC103 TaxID=1120658 RepID=UPI00063EA085|nr:DUF1810 domain-containing protein [Aquamicrobium sp. LC103]TKT69301.1 DUF1810 domain-containing protein [Aquamicrobium sp. LC103]
MPFDDPFDLQRFVDAQASAFDAAIGELRAGRKRSHWIWFVFPQLRGLGRSPAAQRYGIASLDEARAYLRHPLLGPRLKDATRAMLMHSAESAETILGSLDAMKFGSSMTLFARAEAADDNVFRDALGVFFSGREDEATLALLRQV